MKKADSIKRILAVLLLAYQTNLQAEFDVIVPLDFGEIVITDNASVNTIQITPDGNYIPSGNFYILKAGSPAEISFYNYPAYTHLYFEVDIASPDIIGQALNTPKFQLGLITAKSYKITDGNGAVSLKVGGILKTGGTGESYADSDYFGYFRINVIYY